MKRSEMVIQLAIQGMLEPLQALHVLQVIEDLGMLPPAYVKQIEVADGKTYPLNTYKWESEE